MPAGRPWYQRNPADFIMATRGWDLETVGAYSLIIDHLNDRDRPLPDDERFMAAILNCSKQRWRKLRAFLIDHGKLTVTLDGYLTNPRFEREHAGRLDARALSVEHGRAGGLISAAKRAGQTELPLTDSRAPAPGRHARTDGDQSSRKVATKLKESSNLSASLPPESDQPPVENQALGPTPPSSTVRARESRGERRVLDSPQPIGATRTRAHARAELLANASLATLYTAVCDASGFRVTDPTQIDRAMSTVEHWREEGFDFDETVLPSIHAELLQTDKPTRVLGRFTKRIRLEHAKRKAAILNGKPPDPPAIPHLNPEGEDPDFLPLRTDLLERLGPRLYATLLNDVRFEVAEQGGKRNLAVNGRDYMVEVIVHGRNTALIAEVARAHGFDSLWKGRT